MKKIIESQVFCDRARDEIVSINERLFLGKFA